VSGVISVPFHRVHLNLRPDSSPEVVFRHGNVWYRVEWSKVPDRFKELCALKLRLEGRSLPEWLEGALGDKVDVRSFEIEFDESVCEFIPENYPLGM